MTRTRRFAEPRSGRRLRHRRSLARLEYDADIVGDHVEQARRQRWIIARDQGGVVGCRMGCAVIGTRSRLQQDQCCGSRAVGQMMNAGVVRKSLDVLQQDDVAQRILRERCNDLLCRDHNLSR